MPKVAWILCCLALLGSPLTAWAHSLGAGWRIRDGRLLVEAYFDDNTPARAALVKILGNGDAVLAQGKTDMQGVCPFPLPEPGPYRLVVDAGAGHRTELNIAVPLPRSADEEPADGGTPREEFTRYPWIKVGIGVGSIGLFALAFWFTRRSRAAYVI